MRPVHILYACHVFHHLPRLDVWWKKYTRGSFKYLVTTSTFPENNEVFLWNEVHESNIIKYLLEEYSKSFPNSMIN